SRSLIPLSMRLRRLCGYHMQVKCPFCGSEETQVIDTRANLEANTTRRRRKCASCEKRFTTYERVDLKMPRLVKKDGSRTDFDRDKLMGSMMLALRKRPVATDQVETAVDHLIEQAIRLDASNPHFHNDLGETYAALRRPGDALRSFENALAIEPDFLAALNNRGNALLGLKRFADALTCYDRALAVDPTFAKA